MPDSILIYAIGAQGPQGPAGQAASPDIQAMPNGTTAYTVGGHANRQWLVGTDNLVVSLPDPMTSGGTLTVGYTETFLHVFGDNQQVDFQALNGNVTLITRNGSSSLGIGSKITCELIIVEDSMLTWLLHGDLQFNA